MMPSFLPLPLCRCRCLLCTTYSTSGLSVSGRLTYLHKIICKGTGPQMTVMTVATKETPSTTAASPRATPSAPG